MFECWLGYSENVYTMLEGASCDVGCMVYGWPLVVPWWTYALEYYCFLITRPHLGAYVSFFLGALETYGALWFLGQFLSWEDDFSWRRSNGNLVGEHWFVASMSTLGCLHACFCLTWGRVGCGSWSCIRGGLEGAHNIAGALNIWRIVEVERWILLEEDSCLGALLIRNFHHLGAWHVSLVEGALHMWACLCRVRFLVVE
jgi:hypothetical protein